MCHKVGPSHTICKDCLPQKQSGDAMTELVAKRDQLNEKLDELNDKLADMEAYRSDSGSTTTAC